MEEKRAVGCQSMRPRRGGLAREASVVDRGALGPGNHPEAGQLGRLTLVMMLNSTDVGELDDFTDLGRLHGARIGTVHLQRAVNSPPMVVVEVACKDSLEVALVQDNDMVKALAADGADEPLDIR